MRMCESNIETTMNKPYALVISWIGLMGAEVKSQPDNDWQHI